MEPLVLMARNLLRRSGGEPEDVDRARRPAPSSRSPLPTASEAISPRPAGGLAAASRRERRKAASAEEWVQPEPWAAPSGMPLALDLAPPRAPSKKRSTSRSLWPPVTTTACGPERQHRARQLLLASRLPRPGQRPRLGDVRRRRRWPAAAAARPAPRAPRRRAARRRSRRPSPGRRRPAPRRRSASASTTASTVSAVPSIPIFTASTPMSSATARTWATIISGETASTALDPDRVLRRDRGDRGHPVHAAARERLQVGLDAGAAAGVRAGDREHGWDARDSLIACSLDATGRAAVASAGCRRRAASR